MIGLTVFDGWSACKNASAFKNAGEITATLPDNPASLISRRRQMFPGVFLNVMVSCGSLIPVPSGTTSQLLLNHCLHHSKQFIFSFKPDPRNFRKPHVAVFDWNAVCKS